MSEGMEALASSTPDASPTSGSGETAPEPVNLEAPVEAQEEPAQETAPVEEFDEIEYDGEKFSVPKKLKDGFLMQSDYTRKTQEVAEQRKAIEAERETVKQRAEAERANIRDVAAIISLDERLAQYDKIDWHAFGNENPIDAGERFRERTMLMEHRGRLVAELQQKEQQRAHEASQEFDKRYAETNETLHKTIPGWNTELAGKLRNFAKTSGLSDADIRTLATNVPMVKLLHKAFVGSEVINAKTTAAQEPKVEPKPLQRVTGSGARNSQTPETASDMESYVRLRRKQGYGTR